MFKVIFLVKRKADMSVDQYQQYSTHTHAPIVAGLPGLRRYVVNYCAPASPPEEPPFDGVIELWFDSAEAFQAALGSDTGQRALADQANFLELSKTVMLPVSESTVV